MADSTSIIVPPSGPRDRPRLAIVGEAPGHDEVQAGEPFVGASGRLLNRLLAERGVDRAGCYVTNVVQRRPYGNDFGPLYEDEKRNSPGSELLQAWSRVRSELNTVRPNLVLALGGEALRALTGHRSIEKWRGSLLPRSPLVHSTGGARAEGKILPAYHPAKVLREFHLLPVLGFDIRRAVRESVDATYRSPAVEFVLQPSLEQTVQYLRDLKSTAQRLAFDIETTGHHVRCLGLSGAPGQAICIPFVVSPVTLGVRSGLLAPESYGGVSVPHGGSDPYSYWTSAEERIVLEEVDILLRSDIPKVAQNAPFDLCILSKEFGLHVSRFHMDTMLAQHCAYIELPKGLDFLASIYTPYPYYSDYDPGSDRATWIYNCYDCVATLEASYALETELRDMGLMEFYTNQYNNQLPAVTRAESRGILIDTVAKDKARDEKKVLVDGLAAKLRTLVGTPPGRTWTIKQTDFNPNSPFQMKEYLYDTLRLPIQYKRDTKTGQRKPTTEAKALEVLQLKHPEHKAFFEVFLEYSKEETLLGFLNRGVGIDGRIRTHYNLGGTDTRRLASSDPLFEIGTNLQNIPRGPFRRIFIPDTGWVLIKADLSQAEFRIVVWLARIERIIKLYQERGSRFDVHRWNAAVNIFNIPEEAVTKEQRSLAKNGVYGGNYDMKAAKASLVYKMPIEAARLVLTKYHQNVPEVSQVFWGETKEMLYASRTIESPLGSKRIFFGRLDDEAVWRAAYSYRAQELVAGIINRAFALADELMDERECFPLLQVHDEIVFMCRRESVAKYVPMIRNLMEIEIPVPGVDVPLKIPTEIAVGENWYDVKELV